jgi:hypothetical protein
MFCKGTELLDEVHFFHGAPTLPQASFCGSLIPAANRGLRLPLFVLQSPRTLR